MCEMDIPSFRKTSSLEDCVMRFISRIDSVHNNSSTLFAATQSFVIADGGKCVVVGLLAVLREELDAQDPTGCNAVPANLKADLIVDFVVMEPTTDVVSSTRWLDTQLLGSHFSTERQKRAAWALGQLHPSNDHQTEDNFLWIRQDYSRSLELRYGLFISFLDDHAVLIVH